MNYIDYYESPLGKMTIVSNGRNLTELFFNEGSHSQKSIAEQSEFYSDHVIEETKKWLDIYFSGHLPEFTPPYLLQGSLFELSVWGFLEKIPYGKVVTYGDIANEIASQRGITKMSAQAVGRSVGSNPILIIVPCHRVLDSKGAMTGYCGGIQRKEELLKIEKAYRDKE